MGDVEDALPLQSVVKGQMTFVLGQGTEKETAFLMV